MTPAMFGLIYPSSINIQSRSTSSTFHHFARFLAALGIMVYVGVGAFVDSADGAPKLQSSSIERVPDPA
jgi:hypothetical protein